jgi:2-polyprenyl-3-methyl-5-hydroxy-6-metoxy-1,4-benzoquinol methylase
VKEPTRWASDQGARSQWYLDRFRRLEASGADLAGEARLIDTLLPRGARVLDAGCGAGRVGAELAARGHRVVGVDADVALIEAARADHPGPRWIIADLADLDLARHGEPEPFDAAVLVGNVLPYVAPGTEPEVLRRVAAHVRADGVVVSGFDVGRGYSLEDFDADCADTALRLEHRFATWDLRPWTSAAAFAVSIHRKP